MESNQLFLFDPEELKRDIINGFKSYLEDAKQHFQPKEPNDYVTRKETANIFSVNVTTIDTWTDNGWLKRYEIGNRVYYKRHELDKALTRSNQ